MAFYDLHVHSAFSEGKSSIEQLASTAKKLGYKGFCFSSYYKGEDQIKKLQAEAEKISKKIGIEILVGIEARTIKEIDILRQRRKKIDVLLVRGGDLRMNRAAVETPEVDILTHPELERIDSGLNHVLVKLAANNSVAIEINFREVLVASKNTRAKILQNIQNNVKLIKKFKAPIIVCSGAVSHWEMKDPLVLSSFANQLGLDLQEAKDSVSKIPENIVKEIRERRSEKWISPGVKVI